MLLPQKINKIECDIINLENSDENGSHWTAYYKNNDKKYYFDSCGNAPPPQQLAEYLGSENFFYNYEQNYNDPPVWGRLCLIVLEKLSKGKNYEEVLKEL